jgi:hypothetical protein
MNTQRTVGIASAAMVCLLSSAPGRAALVTYQATGTISEADNTAQLPSAFSSAAVGQTLSVDFTVDTNTLGVVNAPGDNLYANSIVSVKASIGSNAVGIGNDINQVEVSNNFLTGGSYLTQYAAISASNPSATFTGNASDFELTTAATGSQPLPIYNDALLSNAPISASQATAGDGIVLAFASYVNGVFESLSDIFVSSDVSIKQVGGGTVTAPEIDPTSAISALTLLLGGLAVLRGRRVNPT